MTPDFKELVKRLRASAEHQARGGGWADPCKVTDTLNWNAADAIEALAGEVATLNVMVTDWIEAFDKQKGRAEAAEAERDRLKAALVGVIDFIASEEWREAHTALEHIVNRIHKALGDAL